MVYGPVEYGRDSRRVFKALAEALEKREDPGTSDLDDEQPFPIHLPLGVLRSARRLWRMSPEANGTATEDAS